MRCANSRMSNGMLPSSSGSLDSQWGWVVKEGLKAFVMSSRDRGRSGMLTTVLGTIPIVTFVSAEFTVVTYRKFANIRMGVCTACGSATIWARVRPITTNDNSTIYDAFTAASTVVTSPVTLHGIATTKRLVGHSVFQCLFSDCWVDSVQHRAKPVIG